MAYMSQEATTNWWPNSKKWKPQNVRQLGSIAEARDKGDLSENSEYDAAKEHQAMLEMKINQLKAVIGDAKSSTLRN